ncbi:hypothetical protein OLZ31_26275 [Enterobacter asburiae]|nr:hypothetical protein [Enterobacter asburiae]
MNSKIKLPPLHFFPLKRAGELTGWDSQDFLQMATSGDINLCLRTNHLPSVLTFSSKDSAVSKMLREERNKCINLAADNAAFLKFVKQNGIQASMNPTRARLVIPTYSMPPLPDEIKKRLTEESLAVLSRAHEELNVGLSFSCKLNGFWLIDTQTVINIAQGNFEELTPVFYPVNNIKDEVEVHATPMNSHQVRELNISLDDFYVDRNTLHKVLSLDNKMDSGDLLKVIGLILAKLKCKSAGAKQWTQEILISEIHGDEGLKAGCEFSKRYLEGVFAEANKAFKKR